MQFYDTYDENGLFISSQDESDVHYKGLWHKVLRAWLYDDKGNLILRRRKDDQKLDAINEVHILSSESLVSCFDRAMFEKLGIHFPSSAEFYEVSQKKIKVSKVYSDNSEFRDNYFLCDCVGEFDNNVSFFIYSNDTEALVRVNGKGILNVLKNRTGEIVADKVLPGGLEESGKITITVDDIYDSPSEDSYTKYLNVVNKVTEINSAKQQALFEEERKKRIQGKKHNSNDLEDEEIESKADDNEGSEVY